MPYNIVRRSKVHAKSGQDGHADWLEEMSHYHHEESAAQNLQNSEFFHSMFLHKEEIKINKTLYKLGNFLTLL